MYESKFPEVEDLVVVQVKSIAEMGANVELLEYNNAEGMILMSELSRRRMRSIAKFIRVGQQEVVVVLRVDKEKGYIDLSKRRASPEDIAAAEAKWHKSKAVHSIMRHVAKRTGHDLEELYTMFGWPMYTKFGHAYEAFKLALSNPDSLLETFEIPEDVRAELFKTIERRLTPQPVKIRSDIELTCFSYQGIDAIKRALLAGLAISDEEMPVQIKLVAPPLYVITTVTLEPQDGIAKLTSVIEAIAASIKPDGGAMAVKMAPRAVTERDEALLEGLMVELERQNQQVDGDTPEDS
eukprot:GABV01001133.1.p1 GENE.GABV01001133.1~~GABV01001133.1.p1  ORF type:complete len:318 (-),score=138.90 GABV01001133.1:18-902(-)